MSKAFSIRKIWSKFPRFDSTVREDLPNRILSVHMQVMRVIKMMQYLRKQKE